ncbi:MAG: polysaccharide deacetylase family protein [Cyclobacteriaceae bacterium]|nr:polysaccharide deacetylase family protein [Cyclobacteriaceae bacterium]
MYWHKTPLYIQWLYPQLTWHKSRKEKTIYVTFDDGPIPEVTPQVLSVLETYNAKATFFCVGDNVRKYPNLYREILERGHNTGNHTYDHLNGWENSSQKYLDSIEKCKDFVPEATFFRPAYGKIKRNVIRSIKNSYEIIMWDVLAGDFDTKLKKEACLKKSIQATEKGSIIIFHDSIKAQKNMLYTLPRYLEHFKNKGFNFKAL